jgi:hypothetical protein
VGGAARGTDAANHRKREAKFSPPSDSKFLDLFCLKEKIEGSRRAHFCKKERISPALCDAAHVHCWVVVSGVTYKSNITAIKVKREREGGQHEEHKACMLDVPGKILQLWQCRWCPEICMALACCSTAQRSAVGVLQESGVVS